MSRIGYMRKEMALAAKEDRDVEFSNADLRWAIEWERDDLLKEAGYDPEEVRAHLAKQKEKAEEESKPEEAVTEEEYATEAYGQMTTAELRRELKARQLPGDGSKDVLVARLVADDQAVADETR